MQDRTNKQIFNHLKLDMELARMVFSFFSLSDLNKTALVNKEFSILSKEEKENITRYFQDIKIYLDISYQSMTATYSKQHIDLDSPNIKDECVKYFNGSWNPIYEIVGVHGGEIVKKLQAFIGRLYKVSNDHREGQLFPGIEFQKINRDKLNIKDRDFSKEDALQLIAQLTSLGMTVKLSDRLITTSKTHFVRLLK